MNDLYSSLDVFSELKGDVEDLLWKNTHTLYDRDTSTTFYDCTNYYFEVSYNDEYLIDEEGVILEKGYCKKGPSKENLLKREFDQERIDAIWVSDITCITCPDGRLYLSTYIDFTTRIPRCFSVETHMRKDIVINPLKNYKGRLTQMIHSDRGSQYQSYNYQELVESNGITHSMSEPGIPVDNAVIESYLRTIKRELILPNRHKTKAEMNVLIEEYLMDYYPNKRIHTKLKMTPKQFEKQLLMSSNPV